MIILQPGGPPDTSAYYRIAYIWAAVLYSGYAVLLWSRGRRVRHRLRQVSREPMEGTAQSPTRRRDS